MSEEQKRILQQQLWAICNLLRGRISGDDYRDYILGFIFYKFLSERLYSMAQEALSEDGLDYALLDEDNEEHAEIIEAVRDEAIDTLGYHLMPSQLFMSVATRVEEDANAFILSDLQEVRVLPRFHGRF